MSDSHPFAEYIDYEFDEEKAGFGEPYIVPESQRTHSAAEGESHTGVDPIQKLGAGLVIVGAVCLVLQLVTGVTIGTWLGAILAFGLPSVGGAFYFWAKYRHTQPGIKNDGVFFNTHTGRGLGGWLMGVAITTFYVLIYWYPELLGETTVDGEVVYTGFIQLSEPIALFLTGAHTDRWFVYGLLYTLAALVFGLRMLMRYRHNRYQILRTITVTFFQVSFGFFVPAFLKALEAPYFDFRTFWPLDRYNMWPGDQGMNWVATSGFDWAASDAMGRLGILMIGFALVMTLLGTPILTYYFGKRWYCSWVCGCGGLAETLGDPYRHLSNKSTKAWKLERFSVHFVLLFIIALTAVLWVNNQRGGDILGGNTYAFQKIYGFWIAAMFAGVIGVGFYPIFGSRVWCRFGCPQAAILGILQRVFSRFRISTNGGQCISCGNCSTYCEMGIDVRAYAQKGENIVRASCVGCGVCAAVCPRGVLKLENGPSVLNEDRFTQ